MYLEDKLRIMCDNKYITCTFLCMYRTIHKQSVVISSEAHIHCVVRHQETTNVLHVWWLCGDLEEYDIIDWRGVMKLPCIHGGPMLVCRCGTGRWLTAASYGGGENTGKLSSNEGARGFNSELGGEPNDMRCGSKYPSSETVISAEQGVGACVWRREPARGVSGGGSSSSSSIGVW